MRLRLPLGVGLVVLLAVSIASGQGAKRFSPVGPLTPAEAMKSFQVAAGLRLEQVAAEPDVVDPVALCFDARGNMYVMEMRDYPLGPGPGKKPLGQVRMLSGRTADGKYAKSTVFADGLSFATGLVPWKNGLIVMAAPRMFYFEDADGDGVAEIRKQLYEGFALGNPQHRPDLLIWGLDNWIYCAGAGSSQVVRSTTHPELPAVSLRRDDFRFDPETGVLEPISGWSQYGIGFDDWGHRFTQENSEHIRQVVIRSRKHWGRNAYLPIGEPMVNIPDHGPAGPTFQIAKLQPRFNDFEMANHFTSACATTVYRGGLLGPIYNGAVFCGEPVGDLVHADVLTGPGPSYVAKRAVDKEEVLASKDNWFRAVNFSNGPDGALYIADMYREHVEHPEWIPFTTLKQINVRAGDDMGRIYRLAPAAGALPAVEDLSVLKSDALVERLGLSNGWIRDTAQRLLVERRATDAVEPLRALVRSGKLAQSRVHALWTLEGIKALSSADVQAAVKDGHPQVRRNAVELAERFIGEEAVLAAVVELCGDADADVRFHAVLALGESTSANATTALAKLGSESKLDIWMRAAAVASAKGREVAVLKAMCGGTLATDSPLLYDLGMSLGGNGELADFDARFMALAGGAKASSPLEHVAVLEGIAAGLKKRNAHGLAVSDAAKERLLGSIAAATDAARTAAWRRLAAVVAFADTAAVAPLATKAADDSLDERLDVAARCAAVEFVGAVGKTQATARLLGLLTPKQPIEVQLALVRTLFEADANAALPAVVGVWKSISPRIRATAVDLALDRRNLHAALIDALLQGKIGPGDISLEQRTKLLTRASESQKKSLAAAMGAGPAADRVKVVQEYKDVAAMASSGPRGWQVFRDHCGACHRLENAGRHVGPNLQSVRNHSKERLLDSILNPSHSVDPAYLGYVLETTAGRIVTGVIRSESADSLTLLGSDGKSTTVPRKEIESCVATGKSLMPEGLEKVISKQQLADLIAFLRGE